MKLTGKKICTVCLEIGTGDFCDRCKAPLTVWITGISGGPAFREGKVIEGSFSFHLDGTTTRPITPSEAGENRILSVMRREPEKEWGPTEISRVLLDDLPVEGGPRTPEELAGQSNTISPVLQRMARKGLVVPISHSKTGKTNCNKWKLVSEQLKRCDCGDNFLVDEESKRTGKCSDCRAESRLEGTQ